MLCRRWRWECDSSCILGRSGRFRLFLPISKPKQAPFPPCSCEKILPPGIAIALRIPIIIVVTKIDMTPKNVYDTNMVNICKILKSNAVRRLPVMVKQEADVIHAASSILSERIVPVFSISCVTGDGLDHLRAFLYYLRPRAKDLLCKCRGQEGSLFVTGTDEWSSGDPDGLNMDGNGFMRMIVRPAVRNFCGDWGTWVFGMGRRYGDEISWEGYVVATVMKGRGLVRAGDTHPPPRWRRGATRQSASCCHPRRGARRRRWAVPPRTRGASARSSSISRRLPCCANSPARSTAFTGRSTSIPVNAIAVRQFDIF